MSGNGLVGKVIAGVAALAGVAACSGSPNDIEPEDPLKIEIPTDISLTDYLRTTDANYVILVGQGSNDPLNDPDNKTILFPLKYQETIKQIRNGLDGRGIITEPRQIINDHYEASLFFGKEHYHNQVDHNKSLYPKFPNVDILFFKKHDPIKLDKVIAGFLDNGIKVNAYHAVSQNELKRL